MNLLVGMCPTLHEGVMRAKNEYSLAVKENAVRQVIETEGNHPSRSAAIRAVAESVGCSAESLRRWVWLWESNRGLRTGLTSLEIHRHSDVQWPEDQASRAATEPKNYPRHYYWSSRDEDADQ